MGFCMRFPQQLRRACRRCLRPTRRPNDDAARSFLGNSRSQLGAFQDEWFAEFLLRVNEQHRPRPTFTELIWRSLSDVTVHSLVMNAGTRPSSRTVISHVHSQRHRRTLHRIAIARARVRRPAETVLKYHRSWEANRRK